MDDEIITFGDIEIEKQKFFPLLTSYIFKRCKY